MGITKTIYQAGFILYPNSSATAIFSYSIILITCSDWIIENHHGHCQLGHISNCHYSHRIARGLACAAAHIAFGGERWLLLREVEKEELLQQYFC